MLFTTAKHLLLALTLVAGMATVATTQGVSGSRSRATQLVVSGNYASGIGQIVVSPIAGQHGYVSARAEPSKESGLALLSDSSPVWWLHKAANAADELQFDSASHQTFSLTQSGQLTLTNSVAGSVLKLVSQATNDDPSEFLTQNRVATTDATVTTIQSITIPVTTTVGIECSVVNRRTGGAGGVAEDGAHYRISVAMKNVAGTATEIAAETLTVIGESQAGWTVTAVPSGGTELIQVTGAASNNITWHSHCRTYAVGS